MKTLALAATAALAFTAMPASAALLDIPLPANTYITFGGLDWAWASPCSPAGCNFAAQNVLDLSYQSTQGWRLPTALEFAARPAPSDFVFAGANVPFGGVSSEGTVSGDAPGDIACASAYFSDGFFNLCNYGDAQIGAIFGDPAWASEPNVETWVVRGDTRVPEPATWAMLIAGFGLVGTALRRRTAATA